MLKQPDVDGFNRRLGAGRHGTVFRAERHGRAVAVKVPPTAAVGATEAAALTRLRHPHVVDLVEHPIEGAPLVLEYCARGTVADLVTAGQHIAAGDLADFLEPALEALDHIHSVGWIHGDISPANIGVRSDGRPVLLDFGASRPADGGPVREGTPDYVGPLRDATASLDVRSMTAVARTLLGPSNRWDGPTSDMHGRLDELIAGADAGERLHVAQLRYALADDPCTRAERSPSSGGTIDFGPRPPAAQPAETASPARRRRRSLLLLPLAVVLAFAVGSEIVGSAPVDASAEQPLRVAPVQTPDATLADAGVEWFIGEGTLEIVVGGARQRWLVGQPGDIAAVGRWSCTHDLTLGVYRPSTGEWFTFSTWQDDAESAPPLQLQVGGSLAVQADGSCDRPVVLR